MVEESKESADGTFSGGHVQDVTNQTTYLGLEDVVGYYLEILTSCNRPLQRRRLKLFRWNICGLMSS